MYLGWGIGLVGSVMMFSEDKDVKTGGIGLSFIGVGISLFAPAEVGSAGEKLERLAEYKYLELEKKRKVENKSIDR